MAAFLVDPCCSVGPGTWLSDQSVGFPSPNTLLHGCGGPRYADIINLPQHRHDPCLPGRLRNATAFSSFACGRERSERCRTAIPPKPRQTYGVSRKAYQGGQFGYLRVLEAQ